MDLTSGGPAELESSPGQFISDEPGKRPFQDTAAPGNSLWARVVGGPCPFIYLFIYLKSFELDFFLFLTSQSTEIDAPNLISYTAILLTDFFLSCPVVFA